MRGNWTRRRVLRATLAAGASTLVAAPRLSRAAEGPQRTIIVMCDGLGLEYYDRSPMPTLKAWAAKGIYARAQAVMPTTAARGRTDPRIPSSDASLRTEAPCESTAPRKMDVGTASL